MSSLLEGERLAVIERRVDDLHLWAKEMRDAVTVSASSNAEAINELTKVVAELANIKEEYTRHENEITRLRERQHVLSNDFAKIELINLMIDTIRADIALFKSWQVEVDKSLPNIRLASGWVFKAALFVLAGMGAVSMSIIFKGGI